MSKEFADMLNQLPQKVQTPVSAPAVPVSAGMSFGEQALTSSFPEFSHETVAFSGGLARFSTMEAPETRLENAKRMRDAILAFKAGGAQAAKSSSKSEPSAPSSSTVEANLVNTAQSGSGHWFSHRADILMQEAVYNEHLLGTDYFLERV